MSSPANENLIYFDYGHLQKLLRINQQELMNKMSIRHGRGVFSKTNFEFIYRAIKDQSLQIFGIINDDIEYTNERTLRRDLENLMRKSETTSIVVGRLISNRTPRRTQKRQTGNRENQLLSEIDELKSKLEIFESLAPVLDLFKVDKKPTHGTQGRTDTFGYDLDSMTLKLLATGVSANNIHDFFLVLTKQFPILLDGKKSQRERSNRRVPSLTYLERLRDCQYTLNQEQTKRFLTNATELVLAYDESPSGNQKNMGSFGVLDQDSNYHCFSMECNPTKTADAITEHMYKVLTTQPVPIALIRSKLHPSAAIISDSAPSQVKANHELLIKIGLAPSLSKNASRLICCMHTTSNCEKMMTQYLKDQYHDLYSVSVNLRILFGSRRGSGYHRNCLKSILENIMENNKTAFFKTDIGSRFGVISLNFRNLILLRENVQLALQNAKASNSRAEDLSVFLENMSPVESLQIGLFALTYFAILSPFHTQTSKNLEWAELKVAIENVSCKMEGLLKSNNIVRDLIIFGQKENFTTKSKDLVKELQDFYDDVEANMSQNDRSYVTQFLKGLIGSFEGKLKKDCKILTSKNLPEEKRVPSTNRRSESSFAVFKSQEAKFLMMTERRLIQNALSAMNSLPDWLDELEPEDAKEIIMKAKQERMSNRCINRVLERTDFERTRNSLPFQ